MKKITVLVVDDHAIVRQGLRALMQSRTDMEVVGEAANGLEAVARAAELKPDVILMDILMPKMDGIEATVAIRQANARARILVLTSYAEDEKLFPAIKAGAVGYLLKDSSPQELVQAIHDVHDGKASLHPSVALKVMHELSQPASDEPGQEALTDREKEVLRLLAQGEPNQEIARRLIIGERTVGTHVSSILSKLHLANRTQAALYALRHGFNT